MYNLPHIKIKMYCKGALVLKIVWVKEKVVKVILSSEDMKKLNIAYDEMDYENNKTKITLAHIISRVQAEIGIDLHTKKIYIEAYPYVDGGCILYINFFENTNIKKRANHENAPIIYKFANLADIGELSKKMILSYKNSIYEKNGEYFLLIFAYCDLEKKVEHILLEYGILFGKGAVCSALIKEHSNEIIANKKNALQIFSKHV